VNSTASRPERCPVCGGADVRVFLERDRVPVHQNLRYDTLGAALAAPAGRLRLGVCLACGFVYNTAFDPGLLSYGAQYENDQGHSGAFQTHLDALVERVLGADGVRGGVVVEVGCGQGQFLRRLVADPTAGVIGHGFDPSYRGETTDPQQRLQFHREMYSPASARVAADALLCRHVIEHIPTPGPFLDNVASALAASADPRVYFETPDVSWIFEHKVYFDVFYEHCSYFSPGSIRAAFRRAGFDVTAADRIFGGQYLWLEARRGTNGTNERAPLEPGALPAMALAFGDSEARWRVSAAAALRGMAGPVAVWGAGAKGATYASLLDPDHQHIDCIVDINPGKQGAFLPGSGHPVLAPEALLERGVRTVVLMNPNYRDEVAASLAALLADPPTLVDA
jgi:hypothetical protein